MKKNLPLKKFNKISFGEKNYKCFIGYLYDNHKVKPLHIMLPKTSAYVKSYDGQTKWMYFFVEDDDLLEKYNTIWDKVSADIKKEFDGKSVYDKEFLKIKIKSHGDKVPDFYDKKIPKVDSNHTFFSSNYFGFCSQERWQLLSASIFKIV